MSYFNKKITLKQIENPRGPCCWLSPFHPPQESPSFQTTDTASSQSAQRNSLQIPQGEFPISFSSPLVFGKGQKLQRPRDSPPETTSSHATTPSTAVCTWSLYTPGREGSSCSRKSFLALSLTHQKLTALALSPKPSWGDFNEYSLENKTGKGNIYYLT